MAKSSFLLTLSHISIVQLEQSNAQLRPLLPPCRLRWRTNQLWVKAVSPENAVSIPAMGNVQWLTTCLKHSSLRLLCLDYRLGEAALREWADCAESAQKKIFIRLPLDLKARVNSSRANSHPLIEQLTASLLLVLALPLLLLLASLLRLRSPSILDGQWAIGPHGRLFRKWQFQTQRQTSRPNVPERTLLQWALYKTKLYRLPELIHLMRGEMRLTGPPPLMLSALEQRTATGLTPAELEPAPEPNLSKPIPSGSNPE